MPPGEQTLRKPRIKPPSPLSAHECRILGLTLSSLRVGRSEGKGSTEPEARRCWDGPEILVARFADLVRNESNGLRAGLGWAEWAEVTLNTIPEIGRGCGGRGGCPTDAMFGGT